MANGNTIQSHYTNAPKEHTTNRDTHTYIHTHTHYAKDYVAPSRVYTPNNVNASR